MSKNKNKNTEEKPSVEEKTTEELLNNNNDNHLAEHTTEETEMPMKEFFESRRELRKRASSLLSIILIGTIGLFALFKYSDNNIIRLGVIVSIILLMVAIIYCAKVITSKVPLLEEDDKHTENLTINALKKGMPNTQKHTEETNELELYIKRSIWLVFYSILILVIMCSVSLIHIHLHVFRSLWKHHHLVDCVIAKCIF